MSGRNCVRWKKSLNNDQEDGDIGRFKFKPDRRVHPDSPDNGTRAEAAAVAVMKHSWYKDSVATCNEEDMDDLLSDIRHLCDREGWDFEAAIRKSLHNWEEER